MFDNGISSLAEIARLLNTTPQAVSNWKARDSVPYHMVAKISKIFTDKDGPKYSDSNGHHIEMKKDTISISDILVIIAQQLKVIVLTVFLMVFFIISYTKFIQAPKFNSWATVLIMDANNKNSGMGNLTGIASQFGLSLPKEELQDLSSATILPEILRSRTFAEKIFQKRFFSMKYNKELTLLAFLTYGDGVSEKPYELYFHDAFLELQKMLSFTTSKSTLTTISVSSPEALLSKSLADSVLSELESIKV